MIELPEMTLDKLIPFFESLPPEQHDTQCRNSGNCILAHVALATNEAATSAIVSPGGDVKLYNWRYQTIAFRELTPVEDDIAAAYDAWGDEWERAQNNWQDHYKPTNAEVVAWLKEYHYKPTNAEVVAWLKEYQHGQE